MPGKVDVDFTDARLTHRGGWVFLVQLFKRLRLGRRLADVLSIKRRLRGATDSEMVLSLVASQVAGGGALSDVDALRCDDTSRRVLGLSEVPDGRRLGEYLSRFNAADIEALNRLVGAVAGELAPAVIAHEQSQRGYVPVFVDGSAIEVEGQLFEGSGKGYDGSRQYWLHGVFVGGLWAAGHLHPGGVGVTAGWREPLESIRHWFGPDDTVWVHVDNAYYGREFVDYCHRQGRDYSVSVTHDGFRAPVLRMLKGLPEAAWTDIGMGEQATLVHHRPRGWREHAYVVIRRTHDGAQQRLEPAYTVILVSRDDLPVSELVARHR